MKITDASVDVLNTLLSQRVDQIVVLVNGTPHKLTDLALKNETLYLKAESA